MPGPSASAPRERRRLRRRDPVEHAERRPQQLDSPANGTSASDSIPRARSTRMPSAASGRVLEQGSLSDPRLADEREDAASADPRIREQMVESEPLRVAANQHSAESNDALQVGPPEAMRAGSA